MRASRKNVWKNGGDDDCGGVSGDGDNLARAMCSGHRSPAISLVTLDSGSDSTRYRRACRNDHL